MSTVFSKVTNRLAQLRQAFTYTREADPRFMPWLIGVSAGVLFLCVVVGVVVGRWVSGLLVGVLLALLSGMIVLGQRSATAAIDAMRGQPGAAAAVVQSLRGPWRLTPAVAVTRKQDLVHRVVGRPGVILVGEGSGARVTSLLKQEHRKVARVVGDVPVHEVRVGDDDAAIALDRLRNHLMRLPKSIKAREVGTLDTRLAALAASDLPLPKGPLPRAPRGKRR